MKSRDGLDGFNMVEGTVYHSRITGPALTQMERQGSDEIHYWLSEYWKSYNSDVCDDGCNGCPCMKDPDDIWTVELGVAIGTNIQHSHTMKNWTFAGWQ